MSLEVNIQKKFEKFSLDVSFESGEGMTGLLGASGCGKSMTLKCIAGILTPHRGRIVLNGRVLFDSEGGINLPPQKRRVGYLFQHYALFPHMTAAENIAAAMADRRGRRERVEGLLAGFQLEAKGDKLPRQLSGGEQQRVALARILASEPEALLLDEPFSALDSHLKWQVELELGARLAGFTGPILLVTHSREEVHRLCRQACVLDRGRSQPMHTVEDLFRDPRTRSACLLSGCKNISRARPLAGGRVEALDWGLVLESDRPIQPGLAHVGVRSHHLRPVPPGTEGAIPCRVAQVVEDLFSTALVLAPREGAAATLRLDLPREAGAGLGPGDLLWVEIPPQAVMPLTD